MQTSHTQDAMTDELPGTGDAPQVISITVELHSDRRGFAGPGSRGRRLLTICAAVLVAVAGAIAIAGSSSGPGRTAARVPLQGALKCQNAPEMNVFFGYRPPRTAPTGTGGACP
jgi:hypothetical protein